VDTSIPSILEGYYYYFIIFIVHFGRNRARIIHYVNCQTISPQFSAVQRCFLRHVQLLVRKKINFDGFIWSLISHFQSSCIINFTLIFLRCIIPIQRRGTDGSFFCLYCRIKHNILPSVLILRKISFLTYQHQT